MVTRWQVIAVMKALVVALRPPVLPVESAEVTNGVPVVDDEEAPALLVAAIRGLDRGFQDQVHVVDRDRVRSESADGPAG
jgi:hypothetical protein